MHIIPNVGWVNVLPAGTGKVDVIVKGKPLSFTGPAYHDKVSQLHTLHPNTGIDVSCQNWGDIPFSSATSSWYWGHAHLGPYYLVWFDAIDKAGTEHVSGYVVSNKEAVGATCDNLKVRPIDSAYPPTLLSHSPKQFSITMLLDDGRNLTAIVTAERTQINVGTYTRWIGGIEGTVGGVEYEGSALWEQFTFDLL